MTINYIRVDSLLPYHFPIQLSHPPFLCPIQSMYVPLVILHWQLIKKFFQTMMATDAKSSAHPHTYPYHTPQDALCHNLN